MSDFISSTLGRNLACEILSTGRRTALYADDESELAQCILARADIGYPTTKAEVKELICAFVTTNKIETPFKNNTPGKNNNMKTKTFLILP